MKICGVILAGGAGRRIGTPKALLELSGVTFLERMARLFAPHCSHTVVVLGHEAERVSAAVPDEPTLEVVVNPHPELGMLSSWQHGLRAASVHKPDGVMICPVDYPQIQPSTIAALCARFGTEDLYVPRHKGRHGHPILFRSSLIPEFLALGPEAQARDVVHSHRKTTLYLDVDDAGILTDVDDAEAYRSLGAS